MCAIFFSDSDSDTVTLEPLENLLTQSKDIEKYKSLFGSGASR